MVLESNRSSTRGPQTPAAERGGGGNRAWAALLAALAISTATIAAGTAGADSSADREADDRAAAHAISHAATQEAVQDASKRAGAAETHRQSPEARAERQRSRSAFAGKSDSDARQIAVSKHRAVVSSALWGQPRLRFDERIVSYPNDYTARISRDGKPGAVVMSSFPVRVRGEDGQRRALDLELVDRGPSLEPKATAAPTTIAKDPRQGVRFSKGNFGIRPLDFGAASPTIVSGKAFFANVAKDTDFIVSPMPTGIETFHQLRSSESPESLRFGFELPEGASLRLLDNGAVEITKEGKRLGLVLPPSAFDADGTVVPTKYTVEDSTLRLAVDHRGGDFAYPLMVDPVVEDWTWQGTTYNDVTGWSYIDRPLGQNAFTRNFYLGTGYQISTKIGQYYTDNDYGEYYWRAPAKSFIYKAEYHGVTHSPSPSGTAHVILGLFDSAGVKEPGQWCDQNGCSTAYPFSSSTAVTNINQTHCARPNCPFQGAERNFMLIALQMHGSGARSNISFSSLGGAQIYLHDSYRPAMSSGSLSLTGLPSSSKWIESGQGVVNATATDEGLGVHYLKFEAPGIGVRQRASDCRGDHQAPCPASLTLAGPGTGGDPTSFQVSDLSEGVQHVEVWAEDAAGNISDRISSEAIKVDRSAPALPTLSGSIVDGSGGELRVQASDPHSGIKSIELREQGGSGARIQDAYAERSCSFDPGCETTWDKTFTLDLAQLELTDHQAEVVITDALGHQRVAPVTLKVRDTTKPLIDAVEGGLVRNLDSARDLSVRATDDRSGVEQIKVSVLPAGGGSAADEHDYPSDCDPSCPLERTETGYELPDSVKDGYYRLRITATDAAGNASDPWERNILVVNLRATSGAKLGLEEYFQYDQTPAGGDSNVYVNGETGNAIWHSVPIVNPGHGLSTVVNLTYNSQDRGGVLGSLLGRIPIVDVEASDLLKGVSALSYAQAGIGFSIGISGPTRVNEPLGGAEFAELRDTAQGADEFLDTLRTQFDLPDPTVDLGNTITLTDADGTVHTFTREDGSQDWRTPPGVNLRLRKFRDGGNRNDLTGEKWAMTRPDGVTHFFNYLGYLVRTEDRNGNELDYEYELRNPYTGSTCAQNFPLFETIDGVLCAPRLKRVIDPDPGSDSKVDADPATPDEVGATSRALTIEYVEDPDAGLLESLFEGLTGGSSSPFGDGVLAAPALVGAPAGQIKKITDNAGRTYDFSYRNGQLRSFTEAANHDEKRTTSFLYESGSVTELGEDRQLVKVVEGAVAEDGSHSAKSTEVAYDDRAWTEPLPTSFFEARRARELTKRSGFTKDYAYTDPSGDQPRKFEVSELITRGQPGASNETADSAYELDGRGRPTKLSEPENRVAQLVWNDTENKLAKLTRGVGTSDQAVTEYAYDTEHRTGVLLEKTVHPSDTSERKTTFSHAFTSGTHLSTAQGVNDGDADFVADLCKVEQPKPNTGWTYLLDGSATPCENVTKGNVTARLDADGNRASTTYDAHGQITSETDEQGNETAYPAHHPSGEPTELTDARGKRWSYRYDAGGNLRSVYDPRAAEGDRAAEAGDTSLKSYKTILRYDAFDRLTEEIVPKLSTEGSYVTRSRGFDRNGNVTSSTDGAGKTTTITYTDMDQPKEVNAPSSTGSEKTTYVYDGADRLTRRIDPKGAAGSGDAFATDFLLDRAGRRIAEVRHDPGGDPSRLITAFAFDHRDNLVAMVDPSRNTSRSPAEAAEAAKNPANARFTYEYDKADERTAEVERSSEAAPFRTTHEYDANGNLTKTTDPLGHSTTFTYDHRDLKIGETNPLGKLSCWKRRADGKVVGYTTPRGTTDNGICNDLSQDSQTHTPTLTYKYFTTAYEYHPTGELKARSIPYAPGQYRRESDVDDWKVSYAIDDVGNPTTITDGRGKSFQNTFYDSGELHTTERPSFFQLDWDKPEASPEAGERFARSSDSDLSVPVGGPAVGERGGFRTANAELSDQKTALPASDGIGNLGEVESQDLPDMLPRKGATTFAYDGEMRLTEVSAAGRSWRLSYDPAGRIAEKSWPFSGSDRITYRYEYDLNGNVTRFTDGRDKSTTYTYDGYDRRRSETAPGAAPDPTSSEAPEKTSYTYDPNGNLLSLETPRGSESSTAGDFTFRFTYDSTDRLLSEANPAEEKWTHTYDAAGNRLSETSPRGQAAAEVDKPKFRTTFEYDAADRLVKSTDGLGKATTFAYDDDGNRTGVSAPGAKYTNGIVYPRVSTTEYDGRGLPWKQTIGTSIEVRRSVTEFDANGNLRREVRPKGVPSNWEYAADSGDLSLASVNAKVMTYDDDDLLSRIYLPRFENQTTDTESYFQEFGRNGLGEISAIVAPRKADASEAPKTSYTYFDTGWIKTQSDQKVVPVGQTTPIQTHQIEYDYDHDGHQTRAKTANADDNFRGRDVKRAYYSNGLLKSRTAEKLVTPGGDPKTHTYDYYYNPNRSLLRLVDRNPQAATGRDPGEPDRRTTRIERDAAEREILVNELWGDGKDTKLAYDANGNVTERRTDGKLDGSSYVDAPSSKARTTAFTYDALDRETRMEVDQGSSERVTTTAYFDSGEVQSRTKPNGTIDSYLYTTRGEVIRRERKPVSGATETQDYTYDPNGNRTKDERGTYSFDPRDRMVWWVQGSSQRSPGTAVYYTRNASGDIVSSNGGGQATTFTYSGERLTKVENSQAVSYYYYDDLGSVYRIRTDAKESGQAPAPRPAPTPPSDCAQAESDPQDLTETTYCFDEFERLAYARGPDVAQPGRIAYDALDRRDQKTTKAADGSSEVSDYSYVGSSEMLSRERDTSSGKVDYYDYDSDGHRTGQALDGTDSDTQPEDVRTFATDAAGSVIGVEDQNGSFGVNNQNRYVYDPYGQLENESSLGADAKANPFRFEGFYYDSGVKTYDMRARHYRPDSGHFLSQDRFESAAGDQALQADPLTQNRYEFAGGNPVSNVEFDGHEPASSYTNNCDSTYSTATRCTGADPEVRRQARRGWRKARKISASQSIKLGTPKTLGGDDPAGPIGSAPPRGRPHARCTNAVAGQCLAYNKSPVERSGASDRGRLGDIFRVVAGDDWKEITFNAVTTFVPGGVVFKGAKLGVLAARGRLAAKAGDDVAQRTVVALTRQQQAGIDAAIRDPNRFRHLFEKQRHKLDPLVQELGGPEAVIREAILAVPRSQRGKFEITTRLGRHNLTVRGKVVNGVPRIGTLFVP
jgi:RHS repeat-associated protein